MLCNNKSNKLIIQEQYCSNQ